jgi:hypothetical protein
MSVGRKSDFAASLQPGREDWDVLCRSKTKSWARHSTRPAHNKMPAEVASRTPLTMLAAVESGLYLRGRGRCTVSSDPASFSSHEKNPRFSDAESNCDA